MSSSLKALVWHLARPLAGAVLVTAIAAAVADEPPPDPGQLIAAGRAIFLEGKLPSGRPLQGERPGGFAVSGREAACALCHQRSGMGLSEGAVPVPPITAPILYRNEFPKPLVRAPRRAPGMVFQDYPFRTRPPYDDETLERAIREGVSPSRYVFNYMMPRYALSEADMNALVAYLHTLSDAPSPGADAAHAHFGTVVAPGMEPARRAAMVGVLEACFEDRYPPPEKDPSGVAEAGNRQVWHLHVWDLEGTPDTWDKQLREKYAKQPVFALVSGLGVDEWSPVEHFCESNSIPCLFPNVDVPGSPTGGQYSFYFFKGVALEAEVLARYLKDRKDSLGVTRVVQLSRPDGSSARAADAFREAMEGTGIAVEERKIASADAEGLTRSLEGVGKADALVLWLPQEDLSKLVEAVKKPPQAGALLVSGMLSGLEDTPLTPAWREPALMVYPYDPPYRRNYRMAYNLRPWLAENGLPLVDEPLQGNTLAACNLLFEGVLRLRGQFLRDYLVEWTENYSTGMGNAPAPEAFPRFSIGPGQRFSSKGAYIARFGGPEFERLEKAEDWITP